MKKRFFCKITLIRAALVLLSIFWGVFLGACSNTVAHSTFSAAPRVTLGAGNKTLKVNWTNASPKAESYDIYCLKGNVRDVDAIKNSPNVEKYVNRTTGFTITGLNNGALYSVVVTARRSDYRSINSAVKQARPGSSSSGSEDALGIPALSVVPGDERLTCSWAVSGITPGSYDVYYRKGTIDSIAEVKKGTKITGKTSPYTIKSVDNNAMYSIVITANKTGYISEDSPIMQGTPSTLPSLTTPVLSIAADNGSLICTWTASEPVADSYDIYCMAGSAISAASVKSASQFTGNSPFSIPNLSNDVEYSVLVTANKAGYNSVDSAIMWGTPYGEPDQPPPVDRPGPIDPPDLGDPTLSTFEAPALGLSVANGAISCYWMMPGLTANSYDVYYVSGNVNDAAAVKNGTKITNAQSGSMISGLNNGTTYSFVVTATKDGQSLDSQVISGAPSLGTKTKRGVSYNFTVPTNTPKEDMDLLGPRLYWFYNWGQQITGAVANEARAHNLNYYPMAWSGFGNEMRDYLRDNPNVEYILAHNEPNLTDQANMTPQDLATRGGDGGWNALRELARQNNRKLVSPAMNYGSLPNYGDPIKWLNDFFAQPNVSSDDMAAFSVHCYMAYPGSLKSYVGRFRTELKFNGNGATVVKPVWLTEFCAWDDYPNRYNNPTAAHQMSYMSQAVIYLELDPAVEKYAWFIPKPGDWNENQFPFCSLITRGNPPRLTPLGQVYVNMSTCDKSVWVPAQQPILAKDFTSCNISDDIGNWSRWNDSVGFRPTTDSAAVGVLDIHSLSSGKWVEYQIDVPAAKDYTLIARCNTTGATRLFATVDGGTDKSRILNSSGAWVTTSIDMGAIAAGRHTLRLYVSAGSCALNWLKLQ